MKKIERITTLLLIMTIFFINSALSCTIAISQRKSSIDGITYLAKNRDSTDFISLIESVVVIKDAEGKHKILTVTIEGDRGYPLGINDAGLAVVGSFVFHLDLKLGGIPPRMLIKRILQRCRNVDDAVELIKHTERREGCNLILSDKRGNSQLVEASSERVINKAIGENIAVRTNHHFLLPGVEKAVNEISSLKRHKRMLELMKSNESKISKPVLFNMLRDRKNFSYAISNPATEFPAVLIIDKEFPEHLSVIWTSIGRPEYFPYLPFYIGGDVPEDYTEGRASLIFRKIVREGTKIPKLIDIEKDAIGESKVIEAKARSLLRAGKIKEAEEVLSALSDRYGKMVLKIALRHTKEPTFLESLWKQIFQSVLRIITRWI